MSVAYQCWEIGGGPTVGYKIAGTQGHQYGSDGSTYRRQHPHESVGCSLSSFSKYMQQTPGDPKACLSHQKDSAIRFSSSQSHGSASHSLCLNSTGSHGDVAALHPVKQPLSNVNAVLPESQTCDSPQSLAKESVASAGVEVDARVGLLSEGLGGLIRSDERRSPMDIRMLAGSGPTRLNIPEFYSTVEPSNDTRTEPRPRLPEVISVEARLTKDVKKFVRQDSLQDQCVRPMECAEPNSSSSSSSICDGREDSSCTSDGASGEMEAQSAYRGPLDQMSSLGSSLPIKKPGLSKFFGGKSRSFSSLADVSSVSDLAKPDNPYAKRRRMGFNCPLDRHRAYPPLSRSSVASISKRPSNNRSTLAVAVKLGGLNEGEKDYAAALPGSLMSGSKRSIPPRSFSLTDLPVVGCQSSALGLAVGHP